MSATKPTRMAQRPTIERCVLCVDDDHEFLKSLEFFLPEQINRNAPEGMSYRFMFVSDPTEGLEALREMVADGETVAMLISDQQMPYMKGTEFLGCARELAPGAVRILLTGHAGIEAAIAAINEQLLDRYLTKPIESEHDFMLSIRHLLDRYEMTARLQRQDQLIRGLYDFANTLNAADDLDATLRLSADFTKSALICDEAQIVLRATATAKAAPVAAISGAQRDRQSIEAGIVARVTDCPWYDAVGASSSSQPREGTAAYAVLESRGDVIGIVVAWEAADGAPFTEATLDTLRYIAAGASIALQNQLARRELEDIAQTRARHLEEARARLAILDQLKSDFLNFISHELRTPLNHMSAIGLIDEDLNRAEQEQMVGIVRNGYERLERLIMSSLDYFEWFTARPEPGHTADLDALVRSVAAEIQGRHSADITVTSPGAPCVVPLPRDSVQKLLGIVLDNAVKFAIGQPVIQIGLESSPGWARLTVADRGRGFPPEWAKEIFRPFTIADSLHHGEGTALNLAKASAMVETYGGRIRASSPGSNQGATFTIELPMVQSETTRVLEFGTRDGAKSRSVADGEGDQDFPQLKAA